MYNASDHFSVSYIMLFSPSNILNKKKNAAICEKYSHVKKRIMFMKRFFSHIQVFPHKITSYHGTNRVTFSFLSMKPYKK